MLRGSTSNDFFPFPFTMGTSRHQGYSTEMNKCLESYYFSKLREDLWNNKDHIKQKPREIV